MNPLRVGREFYRYGSYWTADEIAVDENEDFSWLVVKASWSGHGPMPLWHKEQKTFYMFRKRKTTGEYVEC